MIKLRENKVLSVVILTIILATSWSLLNRDKQTTEEIQPPSPPNLPDSPEPWSGELSTKGYVFDDRLGFGFEYPDGWFLSSGEEGFPDENILKVVSFEKVFKMKLGESDYESEVYVNIELIVKPATDLQEIEDEFWQRCMGTPILNETMISVKDMTGYDILIGEDIGWKFRQVAFFTEGTAYIFSYQSQDELYRMYEDTFNDIINSFNMDTY